MESGTAQTGTRFSLVVGGPFYRVLKRLGLIEADGLSGRRTAITLAMLAWLPPAILAAAQSIAEASNQGWGYFTDLTVPARFLIAIWAMVITERYADSRFVILARQFRSSHLLAREDQAAFEKALITADRRSSSALAECIFLVMAFVSSGRTLDLVVSIIGLGWEGTFVEGHSHLSWAGLATRYVSNPLFIFLVLRWAWWFIIWAVLLFRISRLPLQLIPLHPDRAAGLGFLSIYPSVFSGFAFALSCVISTAILKDLAFEKHSPDIVWMAIAGWMIINLLTFLGPLLVFVGPLYAVRERALLEYGRLATRRHLVMHLQWTSNRENKQDNLENPALPSASELNTSLQSIREMGYAPIDRGTVFQIIAAAGIPMFAVVITLVPMDDLLKWAVGKIL